MAVIVYYLATSLKRQEVLAKLLYKVDFRLATRLRRGLLVALATLTITTTSVLTTSAPIPATVLPTTVLPTAVEGGPPPSLLRVLIEA